MPNPNTTRIYQDSKTCHIRENKSTLTKSLKVGNDLKTSHIKNFLKIKNELTRNFWVDNNKIFSLKFTHMRGKSIINSVQNKPKF